MARKKKEAPKLSKKPTGLKIKKVPDLSKRTTLEEALTPVPSPTVQRSTLNTNILHDGFTQDQRDIQEVGKITKKFLHEDEDLLSAIQSMITFRRGYAIVYRELQERIAKKREHLLQNGEELHWLVEDFLIQYAMYEASKPFNEHQFMQGMMATVMPYLANVIDSHTEEEAKLTQESKSELEERRKSRGIPLGFHTSNHEEEPTLFKNNTLILTGWSNALSWLVDNIIGHILNLKGEDDPFMVLHFITHAPKAKEQQRYLLKLGSTHWQGCANSQKKLALCMGTHIADKLGSQPDLLIVNDLALAYTLGLVGRPIPATAGDAHKQLRKWCNQAGCALIGLVPFDKDTTPDISMPEWEQLKTFTHLRQVSVLNEALNLDENKYRVIIGNHTATFDVEKQLLDNYEKGSILLPSGIIT